MSNPNFYQKVLVLLCLKGSNFMGEHFLYNVKFKTIDGATMNFDNDLVYFNSKGEITEWLLFSEYLNDWFPIKLEIIEARFPSTYADVVEKIRDIAILQAEALEAV